VHKDTSLTSIHCATADSSCAAALAAGELVAHLSNPSSNAFVQAGRKALMGKGLLGLTKTVAEVQVQPLLQSLL